MKLKQLALGTGLVTILMGCSPTRVPPKSEFELRRSLTKQTQMMDYKIKSNLKHKLNTLAGIYAGTVDVYKMDNGYLTSGSYNQVKNPNALKEVLKDADVNPEDKIITSEEVENLEFRIYRRYSD